MAGNQVLLGALTFVVVGVTLMIGQGITEKTYQVVGATANSTNLVSVNSNVGTANVTYSSFLSILAIAMIGGLAVFYLVGYLGSHAGM